MKLGISPFYTIGAIVSLGLGLSFSDRVNGASVEAALLGDWSFWLGVSLCTFLLTKVHGKSEGKRINTGKYIYGAHVKRTLLRAAYIGVVCWLPYRGVCLDSILFALNQAFLFGVFFDPFVNLETGRHFFYHGGQSWYDKLVQASPELFFIMEIIGVIATTYVNFNY